MPTDATLESYDWTRNPKTIRREPFLELATGEFIRRKKNAAFVGASGLGKAHLLQGVGRKCCDLGYRVRYETSVSLIEALNRARAVKALAPKVRHYCGFDLLVIDEFGFEKLEWKEVPDALSLLYKVIDGRKRRNATAVIINVSFDDWTEYLGEPDDNGLAGPRGRPNQCDPIRRRLDPQTKKEARKMSSTVVS